MPFPPLPPKKKEKVGGEGGREDDKIEGKGTVTGTGDGLNNC